MTHHVRAYREEDAPAVRACIIELQEHERRLDPRLRPGEVIADEYFERMLRWCRECAGTMLVVEVSDGTVAGLATVLARVPYEDLDEPSGEYAIVTDIVVREPFRRRGLGSLLLREAERYAISQGATELRIGVLSGNQEARAAYQKAGFSSYKETLGKRLA